MADTVDAEAKKKLSEVVKLARGSMSLSAFGRLLGVSAASVLYWEKGQVLPDTKNLTQIATRAGFTMEELMAHLEGRSVQEPVNTNELLKKIQCMPISELAVIVRAGVERLAAAAEVSGN
ncbi:transcriptional regulator [Microcoleus sp. bin38.metabat.b11b12b14.051]|uniref:helix-turn-helix domain-containing protein n=1 Tax=Microcoleus sp. bin38.metabat.b11b12b14.051 TaxID=2742709 RepID=UPI0025F14FE3|nr:transcriptional regulator [Microcoleus sp. bin38.metabat.b11b12b14.051]